MGFKLGQVQIFVSDLEKAKKWYSENLGMKLVEEYPKMKCARMKLGDTEFFIETPNPAWGEGWDAVNVGGRTPIIFAVDDVVRTVAVMKKKGVRFVEELSMRPWGEMKAVFADPDGNEFNLV